jgi:serine/threonine-protein kinase
MGDNEGEILACLERFRREVQVMAQVQHPNVLKVFDYGSYCIAQDAKQILVEYIVMEYLRGPTLRTTMSAEGFYPEEERTREWLVKYFLPVLEGVSALHRLGIVNRDLKPENVLFDGTSPKIMDFGIARSSRLEPITQSIEIKGTPAYMSPEHFLDFRRADERADVYSLGKILHEAVSGKIKGDQIPFKQVGINEPDGDFFKALDIIILKATHEHKNERIQSVEELKAVIEELLGPAPAAKISDDLAPKRTSRRIQTLILIAALACLAVLAAKHYFVNQTSSTFSYFGRQSKRIAAPNINNETGPLGSKVKPQTIMGRDNAVLHLIPGGVMPPAPGAGSAGHERVEIKSFYMDETLVTNYQFVQFLNGSLSRIKIKDNAVIGGGHPWLSLGEVVKGYEPISYRNGKFQIKAEHSSCPVLRVTAYGA